VQDTADAAQDAREPGDDLALTSDSATPPEPQDGDGQEQNDPWADPAAARKEIEKLRKEAAKYRTQLREAEPKLSEYQKYLDSQKTEQEKLAEAKAAAEAKLAEVTTANARLMAAAAYNIPADLIDLLGTGTDEEINARAQLLSERITAAASSDRPESTRPVESLTAGGRPADDASADMSPDAFIRRMAGR
jgi:DNA repair exonuclease SbcCD ATPase subunit